MVLPTEDMMRPRKGPSVATWKLGIEGGAIEIWTWHPWRECRIECYNSISDAYALSDSHLHFGARTADVESGIVTVVFCFSNYQGLIIEVRMFIYTQPHCTSHLKLPRPTPDEVSSSNTFPTQCHRRLSATIAGFNSAMTINFRATASIFFPTSRRLEKYSRSSRPTSATHRSSSERSAGYIIS